jgi:HD-GYP domain-containing protein (c-di-GMP phosphodiesterase class II)
LDPSICVAFVGAAEEILAQIESCEELVEAVCAAEPAPVLSVPINEIDGPCLALATFADLKGLYLVGHSPHVTQIAEGAARLIGLAGRDSLRLAALVHDIGRAGVVSSIWDRPGPLGAADRERVRLHPHWTERVLSRSPALASLGSLAAAHHERLDGTGYHRGVRAGELSREARLLAAADVLAALTEERPYRPARSLDEAARTLQEEAVAGRLDPETTAAVIEAAGAERPRVAWPNDLTNREVEILRFTARGMTNKEIASSLVISPRTVRQPPSGRLRQDRPPDAGRAAVFAIEHGLV